MLVAIAALLAVVPAAGAQAPSGSATSAAVQAFESGTNIYVDAAARPGLDAGGRQSVEQEIARSGAGPVYIAVLPSGALGEAGGDVEALARSLGTGTSRAGTYVAVAGTQIGAASSVLRRGQAAALARESAGTSGDLAAVLRDFVRRVGSARSAGGATRSPGSGNGSGGSSGALVLLAVLLVGGGGALLIGARRRRGREREQFQEVRETARDDLVALGDDIRSLDLDIEMPGTDARAKEDYGRAVEAYGRAEQAFDRARRTQDLEAVSSSLEEGRYAMVSAKARMQGREPPERRPPCFFDPRHGPSVRDVEWAPPGGQPRPVPACAADALRVEQGEEPAAREVLVGGQRTPYWNAPGYYGPWAGGFFGGFGGGGLLSGLLIGSMLGGGMGFGGPTVIEQNYYGDGDGGGGDFGGGDFGGGDFGGGDFGGGDFGGGDFGGGGGDF